MPTFGVQGLDVSAYQTNVDWQQQWNMGARFAYVKASEGNYFTNDQFSSQYQGSRNVGMIRGAYHFAIPNWSSGADQARYFVQNGGGWTADGYTMPPVLDFEFNPYEGRTINGFYFGNTCYNMSADQLSSWVQDFGNTMLSLTGRLPAIYTNTSWWNQCLGNQTAFSDYPLWVAAYPGSPSNDAGAVPASWGTYSIWQYSSTGPFAGDSNVWNGDYAGLQAFAAAGVPAAANQAISSVQMQTPGLGSPTTSIICGLRDGGCYQNFDSGAIVWSSATGAHASPNGSIRDAWKASGFEGGVLGYPTSDQTCGLKNGGCYQNFQNGAIIWSTATGAQVSTNGPIRDAWQASGFEGGALGYPTSSQICGLKDGGCYQNFQNGAVIWSTATGAQVSPNGPVRDAWQASGFEGGTLGYPTGPVICGLKDGGCYQNFQNGAVIWSTATGAQVSPNGPVRDAWQASGFEGGTLGYPTGPVTCGLKDGGCYQNFQNGAVIWSTATGAQVSPNGPVRDA
ncbi:GH25 family lysozyme, partial [Pseudarthrobacter sp. NPDC080039]|uniref:GH25 family lysozyme n=1 Tax=Pseudarthrobacter sp. NPDC080039 TaxID=3155290 RepID=UPI00344FD55E